MDLVNNLRFTPSEKDNFLHNIALMGKSRDKKTLGYLIDKGIIVFEHTDSTFRREKTKLAFFEILDLFEAKYKDKYDVKFVSIDGSNDFEPVLVVLYPEITISNSEKREHLIRDIVVAHRFAYKNEHMYPHSLMGGRWTRSVLELKASYNQSHLEGRNEENYLNYPFYLSNFCVGNSTDVSRMKAEFYASMSMDELEMYLYCVDSMICWESIEGGPYRRISEIANAMSDVIKVSEKSYEDIIIEKILDKKIPLDVDFYVKEDRYGIKLNEKSSHFIKDTVIHYVSLIKKYVFCTPSISYPGQYHRMRSNTYQKTKKKEFVKINKDSPYTIWRGTKVYPKILEPNGKDFAPIPEKDYIVYPKLLENVIRKLEIRIHEKAVAKSATKIINSIRNHKGSTTSDTVSV